ncbi:hypothetical protein KO494_12350 [Lacinutrix sp. C3R15]|uniref:hypothetical protein n=1 Tax=Flavobacteriaceae TaxID=49546 RepID=UPI001C09892D|nr:MULTISPECIES: hypothetical protein [Flavobacteriaceae]MBU2940328.1 hypothetical protein [Lacinutrix sp. C3R15]MDO6623648.1 hypothetical protein [Oceanihabitans sp. 1_MG-2023]
MKQLFRNIMALSLLLAYSLSISISMQNMLIDVVSENSQQHDVALNTSNSKTPELSAFPDLELLSDLGNESYFNFHSEKFKSQFPLFKYIENYTETKDNQYLFSCVNIQPGLDLDALLYPFHTFS